MKAGRWVQGKVVGRQLNLNELASIDALVQELKAEPRIDYLILNAGILSPLSKRDRRGWELHLSTNHLGHFALTMGLLDKLKAQACPRERPLFSIFKWMHERPLFLLLSCACMNSSLPLAFMCLHEPLLFHTHTHTQARARARTHVYKSRMVTCTFKQIGTHVWV
jgi:NAD(P)-dependent dehydrogenase (short-subunit alcohol dehydrogenase family)